MVPTGLERARKSHVSILWSRMIRWILLTDHFPLCHGGSRPYASMRMLGLGWPDCWKLGIGTQWITSNIGEIMELLSFWGGDLFPQHGGWWLVAVQLSDSRFRNGTLSRARNSKVFRLSDNDGVIRVHNLLKAVHDDLPPSFMEWISQKGSG